MPHPILHHALFLKPNMRAENKVKCQKEMKKEKVEILVGSFFNVNHFWNY
jgi:hypothetical protein